jgi:hypothetical protein
MDYFEWKQQRATSSDINRKKQPNYCSVQYFEDGTLADPWMDSLSIDMRRINNFKKSIHSTFKLFILRAIIRRFEFVICKGLQEVP